ncbi:MAG: peptidoglycan bridge formation glycyltransferase FemA/FemB family protein [Sphaerochaetaceae bacterium]|jgi:lipid II:glycine glycyltransferase (peptidoglycan interpeptide bridge formation enzyme)|nr:peptidoglycan bridge formation glycyltransferase FemA/FemB family protein [Sphaerochaetaceae bacterium]MDX9940449.1 peptidoglycan bridge formation glycyltransferase FemA/FemB family protein [Sphaerochaetaceae bacterium]
MVVSSVERVGLDQLDASLNPFQSQFWAKAKRASGWIAFAFRFSHAPSEAVESSSTVILVLVRRMIFSTKLAYVPFGPDTSAYRSDASSLVREFSRLVRPLLPKGTAFIRFDLPWGARDSEEVLSVEGKGLRVCRESVQPEGTARIDLSEGYDAVRLRYRERARRNIRKTGAKSIRIERWLGDEQTFNTWYNVYLETAKRDGFTARSSSYIKNILTLDIPDVRPFLYVATLGQTMLGGAIVLESQKVAVYLYGASLRVDGTSPSYLLQDHAIAQACERGCLIYDFYGISGPRQRGSHLEGLRLFKRAFGGYVCYRAPTFDYVYKRLPRFLYAWVEQVRYKSHRRRHPKRMSQQFSVSTEE